MNIIRDPRRSLADAEITEDVIKDVVSINFAKDRTEFLQRLANLDGNQFVTAKFDRRRPGSCG